MLEFDPRALAAVERLRRAGFDAALVGGCVRDSLLGLPPHDYDAATAARPACWGGERNRAPMAARTVLGL